MGNSEQKDLCRQNKSYKIHSARFIFNIFTAHNLGEGRVCYACISLCEMISIRNWSAASLRDKNRAEEASLCKIRSAYSQIMHMTKLVHILAEDIVSGVDAYMYNWRLAEGRGKVKTRHKQKCFKTNVILKRMCIERPLKFKLMLGKLGSKSI